MWRKNTTVLRVYKFYVAIYCTRIYLVFTVIVKDKDKKEDQHLTQDWNDVESDEKYILKGQ